MIIDEEPKTDPAEANDQKSADGFQQSFSDPDGDYIFRTEKKVHTDDLRSKQTTPLSARPGSSPNSKKT